MSRLLVKNLPAYVTPERLRAHFTQKDVPSGTITDVKVASKPNGTSRRFGFVGYRTDGEAQAAQQWFDRTFLDTTRISVNVVDGIKDAPAPRPNKRRKEDSTLELNASPDDTTARDILSTGRLFLRNLSYSCTDTELLNLFAPFGDLKQVHIPLDPLTKEAKGMAYVTFVNPASALEAYESLDKKSFQGRLLHVLPAVERKVVSKTDEQGSKKSLKEERLAKRKANARKEFSWGMLYMNSDAVLSSIADRMEIPKADILNPESDNAAVKLALAETHVINETKAHLESQGIILSTFSSRIRSDTTILVKNIPYGTTASQIRELFEPHGELNRVIVPPAGTIAVVEFLHAHEAKKAFAGVAYRRLKNSVIYLEMGPIGMFKDIDEAPPDKQEPSAVLTIADHGDNDQEDSLVGGTTLYLKNLSFSTTTERLTQVFRALPGFAFARVQTKADHRHPGGPKLSMGYGFLGFKTVDGAKKALKGLKGYVLDGHALRAEFAGRGREEEEAAKGKGVAKSKTTKMIVKNVPFEATKKDIRELFGAHGHLKSVRLPRKFDSQSRGFAFLEFVTRREAENVFTALQHTHLLGRHLVLEWAEESEQDLEALRKKVGVGFGSGELPGRKRKLELGDGDVQDDIL